MYFRSRVCTPPATRGAARAVAAPAVSWLGVCTQFANYCSGRTSGKFVAPASTFGTAGGAKSAFTCAMSGTRGYRTTRYPASFNKASRAPSSFARPLWLLSSSSTTAITWNAASQTTKSATFRSNVLRTAYARAVSSALKLTCAKTTRSGSACTSLLNIACSLSVNGAFRLGRSPVPPPLFFFEAVTNARPTTINSKTPSINSIDFIGSSSFVKGSFA